MTAYFSDSIEAVGRTPLVRLNKIVDHSRALVLAKIEARNPAFSVKDRIGVSMIKAGEAQGLIREGIEIIEPTSGNTGIALAYVCALRGYPLTLTMPESMSLERRKVLKMLGARLILTEGSKGMKGAVQKAEQMVAENSGKFYMPQQFQNLANVTIHESTTGPEIWNDTDGNVDVFVSGVGTGGTITGVSRYFEAVRGKALYSVAVEPAESPVISQKLRGQELMPGPHKIQGIGAGFIPEILDLGLIDEVQQVHSDEALEFARRLPREEGILGGISSGAALAAAARLAKREELQGKTIVVVLPSAAERYLSSALFEGIQT
jgi:cysteine synthase A